MLLVYPGHSEQAFIINEVIEPHPQGSQKWTMVHSRDLLRWYGLERITTNLVFSVIRKLPNGSILDILHRRNPLS